MKVTDNLVFLYSDLNHDAHIAYIILDKTLQYLRNKLNEISKVFIWSNFCAGQYNFHLPFYLMFKTAYKFQTECCFLDQDMGRTFVTFWVKGLRSAQPRLSKQEGGDKQSLDDVRLLNNRTVRPTDLGL